MLLDLILLFSNHFIFSLLFEPALDLKYSRSAWLGLCKVIFFWIFNHDTEKKNLLNSDENQSNFNKSLINSHQILIIIMQNLSSLLKCKLCEVTVIYTDVKNFWFL